MRSAAWPGFSLPGGLPPGLFAANDFEPAGLNLHQRHALVEAEVDVATGHVALTRYVVGPRLPGA